MSLPPLGQRQVSGAFCDDETSLSFFSLTPSLRLGYMFFGFGMVSCIAFWFLIPDLTGKSLVFICLASFKLKYGLDRQDEPYAELDELFERKIPARQFKYTQCIGDYGQNLKQK